MMHSFKRAMYYMIVCLCFRLGPAVWAQGTGFTYQGLLDTAGAPANGAFSVSFTLYGSSTGGTLLAGPVTNTAVVFTNGLFSTLVDFGPGVFTGGSNWLAIAIQTNSGGPFQLLPPRQQVTPGPYALYATLAATATSAGMATNVVSGIAITNAFITNSVFAGNGGGLTNLVPANLSAGTAAINITGNAATATFATAAGTATTANSFTSSLAGDVTGPQGATTVAAVGGQTVANVAGAAVAVNAATSANTLSTLVKRDGSGNFTAGTITANLAGNASTATTATIATSAGFSAMAAIAGLATNVVSGIAITNAFITNSVFAGNGGALTNLTAGALTGTIPSALLSNLTSNQLTAATWQLATNLNGGYAALATNVVSGIAITNAFITNSTFAGNGGGLTNLIPANLSAGTAAISITGNAATATTATSAALASNVVAGISINGAFITNSVFAGNGGGLTNVTLQNISGGAAISWATNNFTGFVLSASPGTGGGTHQVVVADVNKDGHMDLISANAWAGTLTVLTNNGGGGLVLSASPGVGSTPYSVTAADVNGDGWVDLISANTGGGTLTVLTNNGSGGFVPDTTLTVGSEPMSVTAADVNGDGKVDLICANYGANTLTLMTNNGTGGFAPAVTVGVGAYPASVVAVTNLLGDGRVALICADAGANTLTIVTNNGNGGFGVYASPAVGNDPQCVVAADVNGDGKVDLICANYEDDTLTVLTNNGSGGFGLYALPGTGISPNAVAAADVNGDGKVDLIAANYGANSLTVLTNNGSGGFGIYAVPATGAEPTSVCVADVNGDGKVDLITANYGNSSLTVLTNNFGSTVNASFAGSFTGSGAGLTNVPASAISGGVNTSVVVMISGGGTKTFYITNGIIVNIQ